MCLLFMYTGDGSVGYKLVLANNRDEFWPRPTDTLKTRGDPQHQWIGGMDLEPGREGGTWLGISRTGRLACLLNILELQRPEARGRGGLVRDFITSDLTADDYLKMIADSGEQYNPFHLIVADLSEACPRPRYISCRHGETPVVVPYGEEILSCDNSTHLERPWRKTQAGKTAFSSVLHKYRSPSQKEELVNGLLHLLSDNNKHFPDERLAAQFAATGKKTDGRLIEERSAVNVFSPHVKYGTRTNSVILVDSAGNCDYTERTLEMPVNVENPEWTTLKHSFRIDLGS
ncbi:transport and Golgi organization protein 2 homolog [Mya arenaria]|uniref:transport and Golgi organization protein 2 homolog n=1 Tax=Mya arenaria TaxID=6604 RepID=UPI0022E60FE9|nr:transport and Golgi organization protein 2 homolog [Mya arenaria]